MPPDQAVVRLNMPGVMEHLGEGRDPRKELSHCCFNHIFTPLHGAARERREVNKVRSPGDPAFVDEEQRTHAHTTPKATGWPPATVQL